MKHFNLSTHCYYSHSETYLFLTAYVWNNIDYMNYLTKIEQKIIVIAFLRFRISIIYKTKITNLNDLYE